MGTLNRVHLIGNLGEDPVLHENVGGYEGTAVCRLKLGTDEVSKRRDEVKWTPKVEWHRVTVWGDQARACKEYLRKGREVFVEGRMQTRSYLGSDGQKHWTTEVVAEKVVFLGPADQTLISPKEERARGNEVDLSMVPEA